MFVTILKIILIVIKYINGIKNGMEIKIIFNFSFFMNYFIKLQQSIYFIPFKLWKCFWMFKAFCDILFSFYEKGCFTARLLSVKRNSLEKC